MQKCTFRVFSINGETHRERGSYRILWQSRYINAWSGGRERVKLKTSKLVWRHLWTTLKGFYINSVAQKQSCDVIKQVFSRKWKSKEIRDAGTWRVQQRFRFAHGSGDKLSTDHRRSLGRTNKLHLRNWKKFRWRHYCNTQLSFLKSF